MLSSILPSELSRKNLHTENEFQWELVWHSSKMPCLWCEMKYEQRGRVWIKRNYCQQAHIETGCLFHVALWKRVRWNRKRASSHCESLFLARFRILCCREAIENSATWRRLKAAAGAGCRRKMDCEMDSLSKLCFRWMGSIHSGTPSEMCLWSSIFACRFLIARAIFSALRRTFHSITSSKKNVIGCYDGELVVFFGR